MLIIIFALIGLITGVIINVLADHLPDHQAPQMPYCLQCGHAYGMTGWLGNGRWLWGKGKCPNCGVKERLRPPITELTTAVTIALLPLYFTEWRNLIIYAAYIAILILIIVIDLEHKLILDRVTIPATLFAFVGSFILTDDQNIWYLSLLGAIFGFVVFFALYWIGEKLFGVGALGFGDVKLSLLLGAMLGFHRIPFTLGLAILLGGLFTVIILIINHRVNRHTALPYGQYLASAGIIMIYYGMDVYHYFV